MQFRSWVSGTGSALFAVAIIGAGALMAPSRPVALGQRLAVADTPKAAQTPLPQNLCGLPDQDSAGEPLSAECVLRRKVDLLHKGLAFLESTGSYSAQMSKRELVDGELLPEHTMTLKCRQRPFSVYLLWHTGDPGREVLYVEGENQGRLIGHDGGWKARLPAMSLSPNSGLAMRDSRYPVTKAGLGGLIELMIGVHETDLKLANYSTCDYEPHVAFDGRKCQAFTTVYASSHASPQYRKSITLIDHEWNVPLSSRHYDWPRPGFDSSAEELDAATLIESYQFTDVDFETRLTEADFDRRNQGYAFR
jgi:hypothetical protein